MHLYFRQIKLVLVDYHLIHGSRQTYMAELKQRKGSMLLGCCGHGPAISRLPKFFHQIVVSATSRGNLAAIVSGDSVSG